MQLLGFPKGRSKRRFIQRADDSQVLGGQKNHNSSGRSPNSRESSGHWESEDHHDRVKNRMTSMKARKGMKGCWQQVTAQTALKSRQKHEMSENQNSNHNAAATQDRKGTNLHVCRRAFQEGGKRQGKRCDFGCYRLSRLTFQTVLGNYFKLIQAFYIASNAVVFILCKKFAQRTRKVFSLPCLSQYTSWSIFSWKAEWREGLLPQ